MPSVPAHIIHTFFKKGSRKQRKKEEASITYGQHGLPGEVTSKNKEKASYAKQNNTKKQKQTKAKAQSIEGRTGARTKPLERGTCFWK